MSSEAEAAGQFLAQVREWHAVAADKAPCASVEDEARWELAMYQASTQAVPRLLAAVDAARAFHEPVRAADGSRACPRCTAAAGRQVRAPCPEMEAVFRALMTGTEAAGQHEGGGGT